LARQLVVVLVVVRDGSGAPYGGSKARAKLGGCYCGEVNNCK